MHHRHASAQMQKVAHVLALLLLQWNSLLRKLNLQQLMQSVLEEFYSYLSPNPSPGERRGGLILLK